MPAAGSHSQRQFPPAVGDPELAQAALARWEAAVDQISEPDQQAAARDAGASSLGSPLFDAIAGNSPFLTQCLLAEPNILPRFLKQGPDTALTAVYEELENDAAAARSNWSRESIDRVLRVARRRVALLTALADISGTWTVDQVTAALAEFADRAVEQAVRFHFGHALHRKTGEAAPELGGLFVLAMGKHGARELNYSSDIDLIVLYEPDRVPAFDAQEMSQALVRVTRNMVATLNERTADGYVFRVDLRLRPDPGSTPVAISAPAAETYYEAMGQNWERAAMIRARAVAGDLEAGKNFLAAMRPFVWRRSMDFYAIQDVHSIKRQIHAQKGGAEIAVAGHNIKLGRGGIREIEFFVQTQQLIFGGRNEALRSPSTCSALHDLAANDRIAQSTADELAESYRYLREIEHRLQMVNDQQTQTLPDEGAALERFAVFAGYPDQTAFEADLRRHLTRVEAHYAELFEEAPSLSAEGSLVFTGGEDHPDTLATLHGKGFADPEAVSARIRGWHHGRYRATRSARAREILTELVPSILDAFSQTTDPDRAFTRFDEFLMRLPGGVQILSLLHANPALLRLLAEIIGVAPNLAETLSRRPALIEVVLDTGFAEEMPDRTTLAAELTARTATADMLEDALDSARRWVADRWFQIGVQLLRGAVSAADAGKAYSDVTDAALTALLPRVAAEFARRHGVVPDGEFAIIALGKHGSRELTATSDIDLVFVYDAPSDSRVSDGDKPLSVSHYYARFAQRLFNALTAPTSEGPLFDVDMRLRPFGEQGPLASSLEAFADYQRDKAWTWEKMALTRARFVAGDDGLGETVSAMIRDILVAPREAVSLAAEVIKMRQRITDAHPAESPWQLKHTRGGIVDLEFIVQFLQLKTAAAHPDVLVTGTLEAIDSLANAGALDDDAAEKLTAAARLLLTLQCLLRLTTRRQFDPATAAADLKDALAAAVSADTFDAVEARLYAKQSVIAAAYDKIVSNTASTPSNDQQETSGDES